MLRDDDKSILNKLSLKFCNPRIETEFTEATRANNRSHNIWISSICSILAFGMTILYFVEFLQLKKEGQNDNLMIEKLTNKTIIEMIQNNKSSVSPEFLIKNKYFLINGTKLSLGYSKEESLISSSEDSLSYVTSMVFLNITVFTSLAAFIFYIIFLIWAYKTTNDKYHKIIFCLTKFLFSQSFHTLSGAMIVHFKVQAENVYFIIAMQLLLIILLLYSFNVAWYLFFWGTLTSNVSEWLLYNSIVSLSNSILLYYLITNSLIHLNCVIISYMKEKKFRNEFYLQRLNNKQRKYAVELLYKMDQGFISYNKDKNKLFFNNSMKYIINSFKERDSLFEEENVSEIINYNKSETQEFIRAPLTTVNNDLFTVSQLKRKETGDLSDRNQNYFNPFLLQSNVRPEGKSLIDKLLKNLINLNNYLPEDILSLFNGNLENILDLIYEKVKNDEIFSSFTYLGVITVKNEISRNNKYNNENKKFAVKYQIMFRVVSYDSEESYLELMFQDVSEVVLFEMEKAILNTRSLYLSKIAHEFRNPISSILELSSSINEISKENDFNIQEKISTKVNYIEDLCRVMSQFLNDYTLFTSLKFTCDNNCALNKQILPKFYNHGSCDILMENQFMTSNDFCPTCLSTSPLYCIKCKICKTCENNNKSIFNSINLIKTLNENFRKLHKSERGANLPNPFTENFLNCCMDISRENLKDETINDNIFYKKNYSIVKADKKLLESALYNLIFHSYRSSSTTKGETNVLVTSSRYFNIEKEETILTKFEISNNKLQLDASFIEFLKNKNGNNSSNKAENLYNQSSNSDKFNKYFELYVAFYFIKKLGSELYISSGKDGTLFTFTIDTKRSDIENCHGLNDEAIYLENTEEDLNRTVVLSNSLKLLKKPQNVQIKNRSFNSSISNATYLHPDIIFVEEDVNIEIIYKVPENEVRVLLIDDEPLIRKTLKKHLENISKTNDTIFYCEEASNCFEAIDIVYKNFINNVKFDIIVIDEYMPFMKGSTFIKLFKQLYQESNFYNVKIISYTAFDSNEKKKLILNSGADQIINKPISFNDFKNVILCLL
jgi:CheY-like chemotaxis protein